MAEKWTKTGAAFALDETEPLGAIEPVYRTDYSVRHCIASFWQFENLGVLFCSIGGKTKFACVDGPEFDGHQVDYDELMKRLQAYAEDEKACYEHHCRLSGQTASAVKAP